MTDENKEGTERQGNLSSDGDGWQPSSARSDEEWMARGEVISTRNNGGVMYSVEQIYLPASEVVGYFERVKKWRGKMSKKDWIKYHNPLTFFNSTTTWNELLRLYKVRDLWEKAKFEYETQNARWLPKHTSSVLFPLEIIQDMIDRHPREEVVAVRAPKKTTLEMWKARCLQARSLISSPDAELLAQLDEDIANEPKPEPANPKATDSVEDRVVREAAVKPPKEQSVNAEAKERMLSGYGALADRCEALDIPYRPISADYEPSAVDVARLRREVEEKENYRADALGAIADIIASFIAPVIVTAPLVVDPDNDWARPDAPAMTVIDDAAKHALVEAMFARFKAAGEEAVRHLQATGGCLGVCDICEEVWDTRPEPVGEICDGGEDYYALYTEIIAPLMAHCGPCDFFTTTDETDNERLICHAYDQLLVFDDHYGNFEVRKKPMSEEQKKQRDKEWRQALSHAMRPGPPEAGFVLSKLEKIMEGMGRHSDDYSEFLEVMEGVRPVQGSRPDYEDQRIGDNNPWWCADYVIVRKDNGKLVKKKATDSNRRPSLKTEMSAPEGDGAATFPAGDC